MTDQYERYRRQIALPELGERGQEQLGESAILIIGAGGLGSPAAFYLAAAGIGQLGLIDSDLVELSNLQRQILHATRDVGKPKVRSATRKLRALNPEIRVTPHLSRLTLDNAAQLMKPYDFIIDATDNFETKFLIADVCHASDKPYSHAGIRGFHGQTMTVLPGATTCYRCVFEDTPAETPPPIGPLGVVPAVLGAIQATEAIKFVAGLGTLLTNRILHYDALTLTFRTIPVQRRHDCPLCGT